RRLRLRHVLLLLLRTGLIVLIVLAAARPLVPAPAAAPLRNAAGHQRTALVVILDNSVSSGAVADGRPVLDRLRAAARGSLVAAAASDRVWLVLADGVARAGTREALLATVDSAAVSPRRLDLTAAVRDAARLVNAEPLEGREVHVMSDLQRTALGPGHAAVARGVRVLALAPGSEVPANRGVGGARVSDGAVAVSIVGTPGARPAAVTLRVGGREVGRGLAAPGTTLTMSLPLGGPGWWVGEVALDADELRADDRRVFAWRVAPPGQVPAAPRAKRRRVDRRLATRRRRARLRPPTSRAPPAARTSRASFPGRRAPAPPHDRPPGASPPPAGRPASRRSTPPRHHPIPGRRPRPGSPALRSWARAPARGRLGRRPHGPVRARYAGDRSSHAPRAPRAAPRSRGARRRARPP